MFGTILHDQAIKKLKENSIISIDPFDHDLFSSSIYYPLHAAIIKKINGDQDWISVHSFIEQNQNPFVLEPGESVQIAVREFIKLPKGITGEFILTSNTIDQGLSINAGHIAHPFGQKGEIMHMLCTNSLDINIEIKPFQKISYIKFIDTRSLERMSKIKNLTEEEKLTWDSRKVQAIIKIMQADGGAMFDERDIDL